MGDANSQSEPKRPFDKDFEPYAMSIGFLVREWNLFQERMLDLFAIILHPIGHGTAAAIWHSVQNDRIQRKKLLDAAKPQLSKKHPEIYDAIQWICERSLGVGQQRDDAIHSPVVGLMGNDPMQFIAYHFFGHPRAMKLKGKDLIKEFDIYRQRVHLLAQYATELELYTRHLLHDVRPPHERWPFPQKPQLPDAQPKTKDDNHKFRRARSRSRQPQSSQA